MMREPISGLMGYSPTTRGLYRLQHSADKPTAKDDFVSRAYPSQPKGEKRNSITVILQTLAVFYHVITIYPLVPAVFIVAYTCYNPLLVILLVLLSLMLPRSCARRSDFLRSLRLWRFYASYFSINLYRSAPLPANGKYIFGYHPHGILSHGAFAAFATEALGFSYLFPSIENSLLTLDSNFRIPIYRDYLLSLGMNSVSRSSCEKILTSGGPDGQGTGRAITIVIGGAKESLEAVPNSMRLVLRSRKGFIKLGIRTGATLVPVLAFGENDLYTVVTDLDPSSVSGWIQLLFKKVLGFTVPFLYSKGPYKMDLGITPHRRPVNVVVGRPISTRKMADPLNEEGYVEEVHARYIEELQRIWDEWKDVFAESRVGDMVIL